MNWNWLSFIIGLFPGALIGIFVVSLCMAAKDKEYECDVSDVQ